MSNFELFKEVVLRIEENNILYEKFKNYPQNYRTFVWDDEWVEDTINMLDFILKKMFPEHWDCLEWFMYDWKPGFSAIMGEDGKEYVINNVEDYLKFKEETWNEI